MIFSYVSWLSRCCSCRWMVQRISPSLQGLHQREPFDAICGRWPRSGIPQKRSEKLNTWKWWKSSFLNSWKYSSIFLGVTTCYIYTHIYIHAYCKQQELTSGCHWIDIVNWGQDGFDLSEPESPEPSSGTYCSLTVTDEVWRDGFWTWEIWIKRNWFGRFSAWNGGLCMHIYMTI